MVRSVYDDLLAIGRESWLLAGDAVAVIALRSAALAEGGPDAWTEAKRMVAEKPAAHLALGLALIRGRMGWSPAKMLHGSLSHYRERVRANRTRLARRGR
ncbi:MAG TPA: hypothetical protein VF440_04095 [Novosphingobium sp.]